MTRDQAKHFNRCAGALELLAWQNRHVDEKTVAERKWQAPLKPAKAQLPADVGLFSDDKDQLDMCEMFQEPTNE